MAMDPLFKQITSNAMSNTVLPIKSTVAVPTMVPHGMRHPFWVHIPCVENLGCRHNVGFGMKILWQLRNAVKFH